MSVNQQEILCRTVKCVTPGIRLPVMRYIFLLALLTAVGCRTPYGKQETKQLEGKYIAPGLSFQDEYTLVGEKNFASDYEPLNPDSTVNVVVEIPAGSNQKWEVDKSDGFLKWDFKDGKPRVVNYLAYPGNYGMIPGTLLPSELGGDGDPLDVIVLGSSVPQGSVVKTRLIGVLKLYDSGEQDDKIIAVMSGHPLSEVNNLKGLDESYPGVTTILETWFLNYKGRGKMELNGYGEVEEAHRILKAAMAAFQKKSLTAD